MKYILNLQNLYRIYANYKPLLKFDTGKLFLINNDSSLGNEYAGYSRILVVKKHQSRYCHFAIDNIAA
jgi:hypothetical protein